MADDPKPVKNFRILPCVVFRCPECDGWIHIERNLPDITSTGYHCECGATYCVRWGETDGETQVEMIYGNLSNI